MSEAATPLDSRIWEDVTSKFFPRLLKDSQTLAVNTSFLGGVVGRIANGQE
jgi:hypothetical protein